MAIEDKLPTRENPSPAQSASDATTKPPANENRVEARETDTDVPNKEIAKPEMTVTDKDGVPVPNPDEAQAVAEGRSAQSDG
ncbi:hypothetical protein D9O50_11025 [Oxalobacteraceae bacterium CAVE-383]|nr:hypothetical protein D9O50_11025 [Oxalobacteraceae bacterium CAVE-383]